MEKQKNKKPKVLKHLLWVVPLTFLVAYIIGYSVGYSKDTLNIGNSIDFCESLNDPFTYSDITWGTWKWCGHSSEAILCSSGNSCFREEGRMMLLFDNPTLTIKEIDYVEGENYPNPFKEVRNSSQA